MLFLQDTCFKRNECYCQSKTALDNDSLNAEHQHIMEQWTIPSIYKIKNYPNIPDIWLLSNNLILCANAVMQVVIKNQQIQISGNVCQFCSASEKVKHKKRLVFEISAWSPNKAKAWREVRLVSYVKIRMSWIFEISLFPQANILF